MATDPNPRSHLPFRRTKKAPGHRANAYGQNPICGKPELAHAIHTGVDERTVGRDKDAGNPADERPDPLLFKVPAIPAD